MPMPSGMRRTGMGIAASMAVFMAHAAPLGAQATVRGAREPVGPEDYGRFETTGAAVLAPDGQWLAYPVNRVDEQNELRVRSLARDSTIVVPFGSAPTFSGDARWLAYSIGVPPSERERRVEAKEPVHERAAVRDLASGATADLGEAETLEFSPDGEYLAVQGYAPKGRRSGDLIVRDLAAGTNVNFGNVSAFAWAPRGALLALALDTETGAGNAVQLYNAATGSLRVLDSSTDRYSGLAWREGARDLAVLRAQPDTAYRDTAWAVLAWTNVNTARALRTELQPGKTAGFPADMRIARSRAPMWAEDGSVIAVGLRPYARRIGDAPDEDDAATPTGRASDVQVWHSRDVRIMPEQRAEAEQDLERTLLAVWHPSEDRLVRIGTNALERAVLLEDARWAVETDHSRNAFGAMFGRPGQDVWLVETASGRRQRVLEDVPFYDGASTTGRWLLWFEDGDWWSYDIRTGARANLTTGTGATFANTEYDYPVDDVPPWGVAGWTRGDDAVLVYDRYDIWSLAPDGSGARRLTNGAAERVVHRLDDVQPLDEGIDMGRAQYLTLFGERTKQSGWARLRGGTAERLLLEDARLARLMRADSADVFAYTRERWDDAPDWLVAGPSLRNAREVSHLNAFEAEYATGRAELIDFVSTAGTELQGVLLYPAAYDPSRKYPMIVYTYERLSQYLHAWVAPSERSYYNFRVFTAEGYFVLLPDIVYRGRDPGISALEAVVPAVQAVIDRGIVDSTRVGLLGHSWGGYQAAFLPTRTDIFAAAVAGAPITNFLSFAGAVHWSPGIAELSHWETGQARMGVPYWEDLDAYLRNSPAHLVHELKTPMLMMFGDADGTVDWHQGVEFYNFARRAGREDFVLLVYPGEDHSLRRRENQVDYHRRILEWFGYWLQGDPPARWITEGTTWLERKDLLDGRR